MGFGERLSWVKGICQKLETSADEYFEACSEYVNTAGKHIKKLYEEVCEWEDPYDSKEEVCDLDLMHDTITMAPNESSVELVKDFSNEKSENLSTVLIPEDSDTVASSRETQAISHGTACDVDDESLKTGDISCSNDSGEICKETKDIFTLPEDSASSPKQDFAQLLESHHDAGSSTVTDRVPLMEANGMSEGKMGSCINEHESQIGPNKFETSGQFREKDMAEVSDGREELTSGTPNTLTQNAQTNEFEAVKVEDCGDGSQTKEMALISHFTNKNLSFKKMLKNVFILRRGQKAYNHENYLRVDDTARTQSKHASSASSVPGDDLTLNPSSSQGSAESEWELL